jgi:hypothetical protein
MGTFRKTFTEDLESFCPDQCIRPEESRIHVWLKLITIQDTIHTHDGGGYKERCRRVNIVEILCTHV